MVMSDEDWKPPAWPLFAIVWCSILLVCVLFGVGMLAMSAHDAAACPAPAGSPIHPTLPAPQDPDFSEGKADE